jgi:hypothetical protein
MNAPGSKWSRSGWYDGVRLDARYDSVFSARDERLHADLRAKEIGAVCACRNVEIGIVIKPLTTPSTMAATSTPSSPTSTRDSST